MFHFALLLTGDGQSWVNTKPYSPARSWRNKHLDVCKKVTSVFKEVSLPAFDALKWNVSGALKKAFAGIYNMFRGMAISSSELRAWLPRLTTWKGTLIYTTLVCLLNKTALLFCCHTSLNLYSSLLQLSPVPRFLQPRLLSLVSGPRKMLNELFYSLARHSCHPQTNVSPGPQTWSCAEWRPSY